MSDRFGPMLVKELRQGLRTKVFLTAFIGFQAILLVMVLAGFASHRSGESGEFLNAAIWSMLMFMLIVITPLRGLFALDKEIRSGTLELLQITNLDAWRIVRGKWGALIGEAMLYLAAALPYFTLRYFLGGVHILSDLGWLALLALYSASLTAVVVGLSGFRSILLRIGTAVAVVAHVWIGGGMIEAMASPYGPMSAFSGSSFSDWWGVLIAFIVTLTIVGWSFLRLGARTIATQAENHSTGVRILTFFGLVFVAVLDRLSIPTSSLLGDGLMVFFFLFALLLYTGGIFCAVTDNSLQSTRIYTPFIRRGVTPIGRILLYPGWGSGLFYVGVMTIPIAFLRLMGEGAQAVMLTTLIIFNLLMQPAVITRLLMRQRGLRMLNLSTYITMLVSCVIVSIVLLIAETAVTRGEPMLSMFFPIAAIGGAFRETEVAIGFQFFSAFVCCAILLASAIEDMAFTQKRENAARDMLAERELQGKREAQIEAGTFATGPFEAGAAALPEWGADDDSSADPDPEPKS